MHSATISATTVISVAFSRVQSFPDMIRHLQSFFKHFQPLSITLTQSRTTSGRWGDISRSETWVPKRGGLKAAGKAAGKRHFPATQLFRCCSAVFSFCCSASFLVQMTSALQKRQCCSAVPAAQHSEKLQCDFRFRLWHVAGVGFRGVRFRTC